jgi:hypothetical protein
MRLAIAAAILGGASLVAGAARAETPFVGMLEIELDGQKIEGTPLHWNAKQVHLLGRDGRLWEFAPDEPTDFRQTAGRFRPYPPATLRNQLLRELGRGYEVSGTGHYLVAHPRGQRDEWAGRFEDLYRSFVHYCSVRGLAIDAPPYPLVGVVCRDRREFARFSAAQGISASPGLMGFYALDSNRIVVYDTGGAGGDDWHQTASVIIHEATHQTAFNTGIHSRFARPPLWVVEGLATMFEAPGVYDSRHHRRREDRVNRARLADFRRLEPRHSPELIRSLVASDRLFETNPGAAYAEAWALTFYLAETRSRKWARYVARTAEYPPFTEVTAAERTADFTAAFGDNWPMLEAGFLRFISGIQ